MIWIKRNTIFLMLLPSLQACGVYSFSGISLPPGVRTFSIKMQSQVALGPSDLAATLQQKLSNELVQRTYLKQIDAQGDLQFEGIIQKFDYTSVPVAQGENALGGTITIDRLTIEVQVTYSNPHRPNASVKDKKFAQYANLDKGTSRMESEAGLIDEIFAKLVKNIFQETIAADW